MSASDTLSRYFTSARIELPWAATSTLAARRSQATSTRSRTAAPVSTVSFRHSVSGTCSGCELGVADVAAFAARVAGFERRRRRVVAAAPDQHLRVAVLLGRLGLVQALQSAVMALVQAPAMHHRQPGAVHFVQAMPQRAGGALEYAGVGQVEFVVLRRAAAGRRSWPARRRSASGRHRSSR